MKILKIHPFPASLIAANTEYISGSYPFPGAFLRADGWIFINTGSMVHGVSLASHLIEDLEEKTDVPAQPALPPGISEDTLLRALALAQNPGLAVQLLGRK